MQSPIRTTLAQIKHIDWRYRHTRDALVLLGTGVATFALAHFYEADRAQVEEWSFDEPVDWHKREVRSVFSSGVIGSGSSASPKRCSPRNI